MFYLTPGRHAAVGGATILYRHPPLLLRPSVQGLLVLSAKLVHLGRGLVDAGSAGAGPPLALGGECPPCPLVVGAKGAGAGWGVAHAVCCCRFSAGPL